MEPEFTRLIESIERAPSSKTATIILVNGIADRMSAVVTDGPQMKRLIENLKSHAPYFGDAVIKNTPEVEGETLPNLKSGSRA